MRTFTLSLTAIASLITGCNSVVLEKAKLQRIQNVTLLSFFASERIPEVRGQGVMRKMDVEARLQIAEDGLVAFQQGFIDLGWGVTPTEALVALPAYAIFHKPRSQAGKVGRAANAFEARFFTPTDMFAVWLEPGPVPPRQGRPLVKNERDGVVEVLSKLQADTAALVRVQYCFRTFTQDGKERVRVTAAASLELVDKTSRVVYAVDRQGCGEKERGESQGSSEIGSEDWIYDPMKRDEIRALFQQASTQEAQRLLRTLPVTARPRRAS